MTTSAGLLGVVSVVLLGVLTSADLGIASIAFLGVSGARASVTGGLVVSLLLLLVVVHCWCGICVTYFSDTQLLCWSQPNKTLARLPFLKLRLSGHIPSPAQVLLHHLGVIQVRAWQTCRNFFWFVGVSLTGDTEPSPG